MQEPVSHSSGIGWISLLVVLMLIAGAMTWFWSGRKEREAYDAAGLNLAEAPKPDIVPTLPTKPSAPAMNSIPFTASPKPTGSVGPPSRVMERPEWSQAAASFVRLAREAKYRQSPVLKAWAKDFVAYPDLRTIGRKYAQDRDLTFFAVSVLRSTNFAKMLRKYGSSPDVKDFFMNLMSSPGVAQSGRALFEDRNVMYSIKDLTIPGLPPLGQLMASGAQAPTPQVNDAALRKFMQDQQRQSGLQAQ